MEDAFFTEVDFKIAMTYKNRKFAKKMGFEVFALVGWGTTISIASFYLFLHRKRQISHCAFCGERISFNYLQILNNSELPQIPKKNGN